MLRRLEGSKEMPSELDWSLAYRLLSDCADADEIKAMAYAIGRLACHSCVHADVCTRSKGPEDICPEYMLAKDCERAA